MAISIKEAIDIIANQKISHKKETCCLEEALFRVAAKEYRARIDLPTFDNAAMDGYAVKVADAGKEVKIATTLLAGEHNSIAVAPGIAVKIMTGAQLPQGAEAVVPMEDVEYLGESVVLPKKIKEQANMRFAGEDVKKDAIIIHKGEKLTAYKLALLASQGYSYIEVYQRPKVAIFATGHELKMHYEQIRQAQIYNSNTPALLARCQELGCDVTFIGKIEDNKEAIKEAIFNALDADLIITSGGVSVGEADFTKEAFKEMGMEILFSKIDIKPGKPTTLGKIGDTFVLNLPGNPLAAILNFEIFGRFLINRLLGRHDSYLRPIKAKLQEKLSLKPGRDTVIPGTFDGEFFTPLQKRGPGMVSPAAQMDGFIIVSKESESIPKAKPVLFIPLSCEFLSEAFLEILSRS